MHDKFDPLPVADIRHMQDQINESIRKLVDLSQSPGVFPWPKWIMPMDQEPDAGWQDVGFVSEDDAANWVTGLEGVAALERPLVDFATISWRNPAPITLEMRNVNLEAMEIFFGQGLVPLCERQIPAEGTE